MITPIQNQIDMQSNNLNSLASSTLVLSKNSTQLKKILNSIKDDKRNEKELFNDMLKMMELHDEHMIKVVDNMQKQEKAIQSQTREINELKNSVKMVSSEIKGIERTQKELNTKQMQKLDLILEKMEKQNEENKQKDDLILKLIEKLSENDEKKTRTNNFYPTPHPRDYYGEFAYKSYGYPYNYEKEHLTMENMRLKK
jgi:DNA repair exonuclease SbcCD ATPase subunit